MGAPIYMKCGRCGRLAYCRDGICDACASYLGATGYRPSSSSSSLPKCPGCGGKGFVVHIFGPATVCGECGGSGVKR